MGADIIPWTKKHSPKNANEVIAQDSAISLLKFFIKNFKSKKKKSVLIYGPSGCGKTSSVYTVANELNLELLELNASDYRNKEQINEIVGFASKQMSLFGKER